MFSGPVVDVIVEGDPCRGLATRDVSKNLQCSGSFCEFLSLPWLSSVMPSMVSATDYSCLQVKGQAAPCSREARVTAPACAQYDLDVRVQRERGRQDRRPLEEDSSRRDLLVDVDAALRGDEYGFVVQHPVVV